MGSQLLSSRPCYTTPLLQYTQIPPCSHALLPAQKMGGVLSELRRLTRTTRHWQEAVEAVIRGRSFSQALGARTASEVRRTQSSSLPLSPTSKLVFSYSASSASASGSDNSTVVSFTELEAPTGSGPASVASSYTSKGRPKPQSSVTTDFQGPPTMWAAPVARPEGFDQRSNKVDVAQSEARSQPHYADPTPVGSGLHLGRPLAGGPPAPRPAEIAAASTSDAEPPKHRRRLGWEEKEVEGSRRRSGTSSEVTLAGDGDTPSPTDAAPCASCGAPPRPGHPGPGSGPVLVPCRFEEGVGVCEVPTWTTLHLYLCRVRVIERASLSDLATLSTLRVRPLSDRASLCVLVCMCD